MNDYLKQINPTKKTPVIESILEQAEALNTPIVREDAINLMIQLIQLSGVKKVLEIGSAIGYSAIMIATFTDATVTTLERDPEQFLRAKENIKRAGLESKINLIQIDALDYTPTDDYQCDLLFIDAAKAQYVRFFERFSPFVKQGGVIVSDNLLFHGMVEQPELTTSKGTKALVRKINTFNEYLVNRQDYDTYIYEIGDGLSISIRKG